MIIWHNVFNIFDGNNIYLKPRRELHK